VSRKLGFLLSSVQISVKIFGFVGARPGPQNPGADNVAQHLFKGQPVALIHGEEKAREHERNHQQHGRRVPNYRTGEQVGGNPDERRASKTNKLAFR
jgi:hypothetical protein